MSLYSRIVGDQDDEDVTPRIGAHGFGSAFAEHIRGVFDRDELIAMFTLEGGEVTDLDDVIGILELLPSDRRFEFGRVVHESLMLASGELAFTTELDWTTRLEEFT